MPRLYGATGNGIVRLDQTAGDWTVQVFLPGSGAQCLAVDPADGDTLYAGLRAGGVRRTRDGGQSWNDATLPEPGVFSLAVSPADGAVYAGTEPSRLFRSDDRGESWRELEGLLELPSRPTWSFPPRPWTSHVRWIAPSPHDGDLILAGIELGGLMRSTDGGGSWQDHRPGAQRDVHSLAWHPRVRGRAYEAGGGGAAFSEDAGETWRPADDGRDRHYTWSRSTRTIRSCGTSRRAPVRTRRTAAGIRRRASSGAVPASRGTRSRTAFPSRYRRCRTRWLPARAGSSLRSPMGRSGRAEITATAGVRAPSVAARSQRSTRSPTRRPEPANDRGRALGDRARRSGEELGPRFTHR